MNIRDSFFSAVAESSATLTGLIFVGVSISLARILEIPKLPSRALNSMFLLTNTLLISIICLVPGQQNAFIGSEILIISGLISVATIILNIDVVRGIDPDYRWLSINNLIFTQVALLPFVIGGILILNMNSAAFYWFIPGIAFSLVKVIFDAWVLLIEIHR